MRRSVDRGQAEATAIASFAGRLALHAEALTDLVHLFVFRGRRGDLIKVIWHDGQGMCLFSKRVLD